MIKKLMAMVAGLFMAMGLAFGQVDVNKADQAALDSVKGIGPGISKAIVNERTKNGNFKDWADFERRVKGIGDKNSTKMSEAGLTVNGQSKPGTTPAKAESKSATSSSKLDTKSSSTSTPTSSGKTTTKGSAKNSTKNPFPSTSGASTSPAASK